jgi:hypothetical protein
MQLLLDNSSDANVQANGMSALHIVASAGKEGHVDRPKWTTPIDRSCAMGV